MAAAEVPIVLTIGHSTRTWEAFLELLRVHHVKRVIDVRSIPKSRHNPQFNRAILSKRLRAAKIGYVHLRKLGGLRHPRRDSPNMGWRNASFRGFADYMQTSEFDQQSPEMKRYASPCSANRVVDDASPRAFANARSRSLRPATFSKGSPG